MAFAVKSSVDVSDLLARLAGLKKAARTSALKKAVTAGARVILKAAKANVKGSRESGLLAKSLGVKVKVYRNSGAAVGVVGPRTKFREPVTRKRGKWLPVTAVAWPTKYAHLVELGTRPHPVGKGSSGRKGVARGHTHPGAAARPFLAPAVRQTAGQVRAAMAAAAQKALAKAARGGQPS